MRNYLKNDILLLRYPFSDISSSKVRPAVVVNTAHISDDIFVVPLTSKRNSLLPGEFVLKEWQSAGLNVPTAVKRGIYTVRKDLIVKKIGKLSDYDAKELEHSMREWFGFQGD